MADLNGEAALGRAIRLECLWSEVQCCVHFLLVTLSKLFPKGRNVLLTNCFLYVNETLFVICTNNPHAMVIICICMVKTERLTLRFDRQLFRKMCQRLRKNCF